LSKPNLQKKLQTAGLDPQPTSPEAFGRLIRSEIDKWREVIAEAGIEPR
jgi:tripartite-type tricarboxylate transporter receptor subunit TctC